MDQQPLSEGFSLWHFASGGIGALAGLITSAWRGGNRIGRLESKVDAIHDDVQTIKNAILEKGLK